MADSNLDHSIVVALKCVSCPSVSLKAEQRASIKSIYEGKDVFLWLPTGFGKSLCYKLLPFVFGDKLNRNDCLVIVISPLVSLMVDQVQSLRRRSVKCAIMSAGGRVDQEYQGTKDDLMTCSLLFCAPEAIDFSGKWRDVVARPNISERIVPIVVDEAHCLSKWSHDFRPAYGRLNKIRAVVPRGTPLLACSATVTHGIRQEVIQSLEMVDYNFISTSPDQANIFYEVHKRTDIESDMEPVLKSPQEHKSSVPRVIVYCRTLDMCANLYAHFHYELGDDSYFLPGSEKISDYRLFGMYHANTPEHNKEIVMKSLSIPDGVVRIVFATVALGMGVNMRDVNTIIHYDGPQSIEDYYQECGRGGRSGESAKSIVYWRPSDCPLYKNLLSTREHEVVAVRQFLENTIYCCRKWLLEYFDKLFTSSVNNPNNCCDVCVSSQNP